MHWKSPNAMLAARLFIAAYVVGEIPFSSAAQSKEPDRCSNIISETVGEHFGLESFDFPRENYYPSVENGGLILAGACKPSASTEQKVISAFAYDAENDGEKEILIAIVDPHMHKVVASHQYKYVENPGGIGKVRIDTARYELARGIRAFGVDITPGYSHNCGDGGGGAERTLYVIEGQKIRPILYLPSMSYWAFIRGSKCAGSSGHEIVENINLSIELSDSETNGYRDLVISATNTRSDGKPIGNGKFRYKLRYDGKQYPTQEMDPSFYTWQQIGNHLP